MKRRCSRNTTCGGFMPSTRDKAELDKEVSDRGFEN